MTTEAERREDLVTQERGPRAVQHVSGGGNALTQDEKLVGKTFKKSGLTAEELAEEVAEIAEPTS